MDIKYQFVFLLFLLLSCKSSTDSKEEVILTATIEYPEEVMKMFDAHGGLEKWKEQATMSFHFTSGEKKEFHTIDLNNRKTLINGNGYDIGFNGIHAWISPDKSNNTNINARFYHNLYFYFHSLVFLVGDEGVNYEVQGKKLIDEEEFLAISITYGEDVGDSPDDEYVLLLDPESFLLKRIMYTVTFFSGKKSNRYSGIKYTKWQEKDGLLLPTELRWYQMDNNIFGEEKSLARFADLVLSVDPPEQQIFDIPEIAVIDTLK